MFESLPCEPGLAAGKRASRDDRGPAPGLSLAACGAGGCHHLQCRRAAAAADRLRRPQAAGQLRWLAAMAHSRPYLARRLGVAPHVVRQAQDGTLHPLPDGFAEAVGRLHRELADAPGTSAASARMAARLGWPASIDATGTRRRLRALARMRWDCAALAARLPDEGPAAAGQAVLRRIRDGHAQAWIPAPLAAAVADLYDKLWDVPGGSQDALRTAAARNWAPPLAWDDDPGDPHHIDDPACPVSNWRRPHRTPPPGRLEDARELLDGFGVADRELAAQRLGLSRNALDKLLSRARAS